VSNVYTASGAIAVSDVVALVNAPAAVTMTLGGGAVDGHVLAVKRFGAGAVSLVATIDGVAATTIAMNSVSLKEAVSLSWSQSLNTWLMI
jgi:hypothetical protein